MILLNFCSIRSRKHVSVGLAMVITEKDSKN